MYWNISDKERLIGAFKFARDDHSIKILLSDLLSEKEIETLATRLKAACLLYDGVAYTKITEMTGLSSKSIAEISKKMIDKKGGFQETMSRFKERGHSYFD